MKKPIFLTLIISSLFCLSSCKEDLHELLDLFDREDDDELEIDPEDFSPDIDNKYFPLPPGDTYFYDVTSVEDGETIVEHVESIVTHDTKEIMGVTCRVVHVIETDDEGNLLEDTYDWYAQDDEGNVWYFGEDTKAYEEDGTVSTEGSWEAGVDGAEPGIIMYADPEDHIGETYYQEYYSGEAVDQGTIVNVNSTVEIVFGTFYDCVKIKEFTALEPGIVEYNYYAENIGLVLEEVVEGGNERVELIRIER